MFLRTDLRSDLSQLCDKKVRIFMSTYKKALSRWGFLATLALGTVLLSQPASGFTCVGQCLKVYNACFAACKNTQCQINCGTAKNACDVGCGTN